MRRLTLTFVAALLVLSAAPAAAMRWSIGGNLAFTSFQPTEDAEPGVSSFAWPSSGWAPGLRVGFTGQNPQHEFYVNTSLSLENIEDFVSTRDFVVTGNYQYNFPSASNVNFYVTGGGGFGLVGIKDESPGGTLDVSATSAIFGVGGGVRHKMGNGHGTLRGEVRYDRFSEGEDGSFILVSEGGQFGVVLGFDLWD